VTDSGERVVLVPGPGTLWAFAGTVLSSAAAVFSLGVSPRAFVATALAFGMLALSVRCASIHKARAPHYFAAQSALALAVLVIGEGRGVLVMMPLLAQLVLAARRRVVVVYTVAWALAVGLTFAPFAPTFGLLLGQLVGIVAAMVFTIVFSEVAVSERRARTRSEALARELEAAQGRIAELAVAEERMRLASEIHDGLGHALTAARMQLEGAAAVIDRDPMRAKEALGKASRLVRDGLADVRQSVRAMRLEAPVVSLSERLRQLVREAEGLPVELELRGTSRPLLAAEEHALFRVAQEALTNVGRHARATRAVVVLGRLGAETTLEITDDGQGGEVVFGVGLTGMKERLERLGGRLSVQAGEGGGLHLRAVLPEHPFTRGV